MRTEQNVPVSTRVVRVTRAASSSAGPTWFPRVPLQPVMEGDFYLLTDYFPALC